MEAEQEANKIVRMMPDVEDRVFDAEPSVAEYNLGTGELVLNHFLPAGIFEYEEDARLYAAERGCQIFNGKELRV